MKNTDNYMTKFSLIIILTLLFTIISCGQSKSKITEDFDKIYNDLANNYVYLNDKHVDMDCIKTTYKSKIKTLKGIVYLSFLPLIMGGIIKKFLKIFTQLEKL